MYKYVIRKPPFNLKEEGWGYGFLFRSEIFFRTTQELEYLFFFQNLTLHVGYMTKTLNQIFFSLHQNQNIFFSNIENQNIFFEKNHNPPPLQVKRSFP
jgi:transcription initiation factor IIF auxiliary subunit